MLLIESCCPSQVIYDIDRLLYGMLGGKTYSQPSYIFSAGQDPNPQDSRPCAEFIFFQRSNPHGQRVE